jgi:hypothetical protein
MNMPKITLPPDEAAKVTKLLRFFNERARHEIPFTLENLIARWKRFVGEVQEGYRGNIYDYTNDLTIRDLLEDILVILLPETRNMLAAVISPIDDDFTRTTRPTKHIILGRQQWWSNRIPVLLIDELSEDVIEWGL